MIDAEALKEHLKQLSPEEKEEAITTLQGIIDEAMVDYSREDNEERIVCPKCGSNDLIWNGHNTSGNHRHKCKKCGHSFVHRNVGNILGLTKLDKKQWLTYCRCFVEAKSIRHAAKECEVSIPTSLFMRRRMLEIVEKVIPAFEIKKESNIELDEMYFPESFKGNHLKTSFKLPRASRKNGRASKKRGLSNEKIAVITGIADGKDIFYDVACRGNVSIDVAEKVLKDKVLSGAIVSTDKHHSYVAVMRKFNVKCHKAFDSKTHKGLGHVNALHGKIRDFISIFKGVSTKWLHQYLAWFKWLDSFRGCHHERLNIALGHMILGDYEHSRRELRKLSTPFYDVNGNPTKC